MIDGWVEDDDVTPLWGMEWIDHALIADVDAGQEIQNPIDVEVVVDAAVDQHPFMVA
jgi:hypothetical protein